MLASSEEEREGGREGGRKSGREGEWEMRTFCGPHRQRRTSLPPSLPPSLTCRVPLGLLQQSLYPLGRYALDPAYVQLLERRTLVAQGLGREGGREGGRAGGRAGKEVG